MRFLALPKSGILLLLVSILLYNCSSERKETNILFLSAVDNSSIQESLEAVCEERQWRFQTAAPGDWLTDDSLQTFSSIVLPFSTVSELDHRAVVTLKRYLDRPARRRWR